MALAAAGSGAAQDPPPAPKRANELTLAGLRPGKSTLRDAERLLGKPSQALVPDTRSTQWWDSCSSISVKVTYNDVGAIQTVTTKLMPQGYFTTQPNEQAFRNWRSPIRFPEEPPDPASCIGQEQTKIRLTSNRVQTGRGLALGDPKQRVLQLYGPPDSSGPAMLAGRQAEFLYYAFDGAGSDVPQVLEVTCDRETGRVIKIILAFPSL